MSDEPYIVGEQGPEFILPISGPILSNEELCRMFTGETPSDTGTISFTPAMDPLDVGQKIKGTGLHKRTQIVSVDSATSFTIGVVPPWWIRFGRFMGVDQANAWPK